MPVVKLTIAQQEMVALGRRVPAAAPAGPEPRSCLPSMRIHHGLMRSMHAGARVSASSMAVMAPPAPALLPREQEEEERVSPESVKRLCAQGQAKRAVEALERLLLVGGIGRIDRHLIHCVLKEAQQQEDPGLAAQVHAVAAKAGLLAWDTFLCNQLIRAHSRHGNLTAATAAFRAAAQPNAHTWSFIIAAHVTHGHPARAVRLYQELTGGATSAQLDSYVVVAALQACAGAGDLAAGRRAHADAARAGVAGNLYVCNALVDMYAKCGSVGEARAVWDGLGRRRDVVSWTAMIAGYAQQAGMGWHALRVYGEMVTAEAEVEPDVVTYVSVLRACASVGAAAAEVGRGVHARCRERGVDGDEVVGGSLVNMYVKCGCVEEARRVFDGLPRRSRSVVTWNAMIAGYAEGGEGGGWEALRLYRDMQQQQEHGGSVMAAADGVTFVSLLQACASVGAAAVQEGRRLHAQVRERGLDCDVVVGGSLVNMYVKCGSVVEARAVFDALGDGHKNVVTWTAMIAGYAGSGGEESAEALRLYAAMRRGGGVAPSAVTYALVLDACGSVGAVRQGRRLHAEIQEQGLLDSDSESSSRLGTHLVHMYAKCGRMDACRQVFDAIPVKDVVAWTALIQGYAEHGYAGAAIRCFHEMLQAAAAAAAAGSAQQQEEQPDEVTYACLLTACSHEGMVAEATGFFCTMSERHGVRPTARLYGCMVDLLSRAGHLRHAESLIHASGLTDDPVGWTALLSGCKAHGDAATGHRAFAHLAQLDPASATPYLLLAGLYANAGRWGDADAMERARAAAGARKVPGKACIEVAGGCGEVREFTVGGDGDGVADAARSVNARARREGGHVPHTQLVLLGAGKRRSGGGGGPAEERDREEALCGHAEKLALAYGLLNTPAGAPLLVTKNLRMCGDCHSSTKVVSRLERRQIVVRDGHKVHRFVDGACSCQDRP